MSPELAAPPPPLEPAVRALLRARGLPEGAPEEFVETALMTCFRDTRRPEVFDALYARTRGGLLGWILHLLAVGGDRRDPLELLQDTYVNVYRYAGTFREERARAFRSWARTVAANVVRRARVRSRGWSLTALPEGLDEPADVRGGPSALLAGEEQRRSLAGALVLLLLHYAAAYERLVPRDRRALQMVEVERRGYAVSITEAGTTGALRVRLGNFAAREEAERQLRNFKREGMNGIVINLPQAFRPVARSSVP